MTGLKAWSPATYDRRALTELQRGISQPRLDAPTPDPAGPTSE